MRLIGVKHVIMLRNFENYFWYHGVLLIHLYVLFQKYNQL